MARNSAAYILVVLVGVAFIVGALVLTTIDPVMQALFGSPAWSSSTETGTDLLSWITAVWSFIGAALLIGMLMEVWIRTRQPT